MSIAVDPLAAELELPCGVRLPNRLGKAAMSEQLGSRTNGPTQALETLYARWGAGGAGLVLTGNVMVSRNHLGEPKNVVVEDERDLAGLRAWADAGQAQGAHVWVQINHPGRQAARGIGAQPVAPSAVGVKMAGPVFATPRALEDREIEELVQRYATTARVCRLAGFKGVQVHGAHGYLVSQFLSPRVNQRADRWGGPLENRMRFLLEVVAAMRAEVGPGYPVGVKLNSADFQRGGFTEEESMEVVAALAAAGIDLLEISGGTYEQPAMQTDQRAASTRAREAYFLDYAEKVRGVAPGLPLMVTGGFRSPEGMRDALVTKAADVVGVARPTAIAPELCRELLAGRAEPAPSTSVKVGVKQLDALTDIYWHTRQLHRMGAGRDPDPSEPAWRATVAAISENGWAALRRKRG